MIGAVILVFGIGLLLSTVKRPMWLGGQRRRKTSEDTATAAMNRATKRTGAIWAILIGGIFLSGGF